MSNDTDRIEYRGDVQDARRQGLLQAVLGVSMDENPFDGDTPIEEEFATAWLEGWMEGIELS